MKMSEGKLGVNFNDLSDIQKFYYGRTVFITGGTGFLGNVLLDKLLRSCPGINKIYILTRAKKGKDPKDRFKELFDGVLFERMKRECPDYMSKVSPIIGDCMKSNLGISENDKNIIIDEVEIIFHAAATVRFDAHLRDAVSINIRATSDLLDIAHSMKQLKAFVHVSTAYSNCAERKIVDEKFYDPPVAPDNLLKATDSFSDKLLTRLTPILITPWPNTYAFTKAIAEDVIRSKGGDFPTTIVRPAIVIATAKEPITGWINNYYGPTGVVAGAGLGLLRTLHADGNCIADLVPCDNVVNAIIAAAWDISKTKNKPEEIANENEKVVIEDDNKKIPIYNYVSSNVRPLRWKDFMYYNELAEPEIPSVLAIWVYCLTLNKYKFMHQIYCVFLHFIPALIVDTYAKLVGREPKLWNAYEKIHKFSEVISYFSTKEWKFIDSNTRNLCNKLSDKDKELFDFDLSKLDWKEYFYHHIRGLRVYLVQDKLDTVEEALMKRRRLLIAHYSLKILFYCLFFSIIFQILKWIF